MELSESAEQSNKVSEGGKEGRLNRGLSEHFKIINILGNNGKEVNLFSEQFKSTNEEGNIGNAVSEFALQYKF